MAGRQRPRWLPTFDRRLWIVSICAQSNCSEILFRDHDATLEREHLRRAFRVASVASPFKGTVAPRELDCDAVDGFEGEHDAELDCLVRLDALVLVVHDVALHARVSRCP